MIDNSFDPFFVQEYLVNSDQSIWEALYEFLQDVDYDTPLLRIFSLEGVVVGELNDRIYLSRRTL
jgi:hypothetical protein